MVIRSPFLALLFDWAQAIGVGSVVDEVRDELAIPESNGTLVKTMTLAISAYRSASDLIAKRLRDGFVGLHVAADFPRGSYGLLEFTAQHAPTVGEALNRVARYLPLVTDTCRLDVRRSPSEFSMVHRVPGETLCLGRHANEFVLATLLRVAREGARTFVRPVRVQFAHPEPDDASELMHFFGTKNIYFSAGRNQLVLDEQSYSMPIVSRDDRLFPWLDSYASTLLPSDSVRDEPIAGLRDAIRQSLQNRTVATLSEIAHGMRISPRTLQRRLRDARTSFRDELDEVRRELAESYLRDPKRSIKEIASILGYADRNGFERAFRKWCRATPNAFRSALASPMHSM